ncbi:hypothetical protein M407DRAFT_135489 [Tulasnella calospora MUT 4182]|uniref:Uncharacterized protein n=1 Tax=Tulasnella calospora MUT 4182 TaxID=1051891 RepID=A0A0C3QHF9_9AGAM|nr:hypothetical protein M407DRAFT_135489 [Tulasnella calospora MUT 4182]
MPEKPRVSSRTHEWKRYHICRRHLGKKDTKLENFIRTYGTCTCFVTCRGSVHAEDSWNIMVDKKGNGRCDDDCCNQFYLIGRCGFVDLDGKCYWEENLNPIRTSEGAHLILPPPKTDDEPSGEDGTRRDSFLEDIDGLQFDMAGFQNSGR